MKIRAWKNLGILNDVFSFGMKLNTNPVSYLFDHIFAPIREPTAAGMQATQYIDVGFTTAEVGDYYFTQYSGNFFPETWTDAAIFRIEAAANRVEIVNTIRAIIKKNMYKYQRLIELQGYSWNPLWNVDGTVLRAHIEQHGGETVTTQQDTETTHSVAPYDNATMKTAYKDRTEANPANNIVTTAHTAEAHSVAASDNAFGEALTAGDFYHAEKEVRTGNIGVTKTTELLTDARRVVLWNILDEFFNDINTSILIGIF